MQFLEGSYESSLEDRIARLGAAENNISSLESRVNTIESWRNSPAAKLTRQNTSMAGLSVDVLGVGVMTATGTSARLTAHATAINAIQATLEAKGITQPQ